MKQLDYIQKFKHVAVAVLAFVLALVLTLTSTDALQRTTSGATTALAGTPVSLGEITVEAEKTRLQKEDILWLARVIYSETKRPHEQELVAWVVRNRLETGYRGADSYRDVVLDRYQFSAFNGGAKRRHYSSLKWTSQEKGFQTALSIAAKIATAPASERPFSEQTRHFFSRQSMVGGATPAWAKSKRPVSLDRDVEPDRFRFYEKVS